MTSYNSSIQTILTRHEGEAGDFYWFHPRATAIPGKAGGPPAVVMTISRHLGASDHYSGLHVMHSADLGRTWTPPAAAPELDWVRDGSVDIAVADVTPGYHAPTGKVIAVGAQVRYDCGGEQLEDTKRAHQTAYAVYDPGTGSWTRWKRLEMPSDERFDFARNACAQWIVAPDGTLLLPFYFGESAKVPWSITVAQFAFDGREATYLRHGTELHMREKRGLGEPSLVECRGRHFLTIRSDDRGYVASGRDGLAFDPIKPWLFDDGAELGSYNTQQHWLAHGGTLFLIYTRRGADNDHIVRHRAPLFMAEVDQDRLCVIRSTERVLIPARFGELGNSGAAPITDAQSWVTVSEGWVDSKFKTLPGTESRTLIARIAWG